MEIRSGQKPVPLRGFRDALRPPVEVPSPPVEVPATPETFQSSEPPFDLNSDIPPGQPGPPDQPGPPLEPPGSIAEEIERLRRERAEIWKNLDRELLAMHAADIATQKELFAKWNAMVFQQIVPSAFPAF